MPKVHIFRFGRLIFKFPYILQTSPQFCSHCNSHSSPIETVKTLACAPEVLVLYFDRFVNFGWKHTKIKSLVSFPFEELDLSDYIDTQSNYFESSFKQNPIYDLNVVIEHVGTDKTRNRYITIAKHLPEGKWFEYDDHLVREISESNLRKREVLFLFYVKRKPSAETTHRENHLPLSEIQELCHDMLEKRYDDIQNERKYLSKFRKRKLNKFRRNDSRHQETLNRHDISHNQLQEDKECEDGTAQESCSGDPGLSEKTLKVPLAHSSPSHSKWQIIRDNLEVIRGYRRCVKPLKLNSKWQIVQHNLSTIVEMKRNDLSTNAITENHEEIREDLESQNAPQRGRSAFNQFIQTSFRKSQKIFAPLTTNHRNNLIHSFLKSTIFTVRYLDDNEINLECPDEKYLISNTLPPIDDLNPNSSLVYVSSYWLMKFLSFSNPGPICNHDIACSHGYLKPHLHGCKKYVCIPITVSLLLQIENYLYEEFNYPLFLEQSLSVKQCLEDENLGPQRFRYLK